MFAPGTYTAPLSRLTLQGPPPFQPAAAARWPDDAVMRGLAATTVLAVAYLPVAASHGSMIMPPPRNAIDVETPAWSDAKHPKTGVIEPYDCSCTNGTDPCNNGQACFWFSQGCSIGCKACDSLGSRLPNWAHCAEVIEPTLNDPKYRTANQRAKAGSLEDIWKYNPWRAPGMAPVEDACGMAGGSPVEVFNAGAYNTTIFAKQGDLGSKVLPPRPSGTVWRRGQTATVRFEQTAGHGGGYQYRLCPASEPLTEACFQKLPLQFAKEVGVFARVAVSASVGEREIEKEGEKDRDRDRDRDREGDREREKETETERARPRESKRASETAKRARASEERPIEREQEGQWKEVAVQVARATPLNDTQRLAVLRTRARTPARAGFARGSPARSPARCSAV